MRFVPLIAACLLLSTGTLAATKPVPPAKAATPAQEPEELTRFEASLPKLDLWPEQKPRIQKLLQDVRAELKAVQAAPGTPESKEPKLKALHLKARDRLNHIITVAQAEKLKMLMAPPKKPSAGGPGVRK
jgi:hypothetical protein